MTKTDKSFGLSRVLPKLFLQAMSGDLPNGALSTEHFRYVCEKVNRNKLDNFLNNGYLVLEHLFLELVSDSTKERYD